MAPKRYALKKAVILQKRQGNNQQLPPSRFRLAVAARAIRKGHIVAYPTESVFGLGCDPLNVKSVHRILEIKRRPLTKGLILISDQFARLANFIEPLDRNIQASVLASWPGPVTWLLPAQSWVPRWIRGDHSQIAVRVTAHPIAAALCRYSAMPIISTSANLSSRPPARSLSQVRLQLGHQIDTLLPGPLGGLSSPSQIIDATTGQTIRP
jgi:L-threonylcarbamoyladenylate synthase